MTSGMLRTSQAVARQAAARRNVPPSARWLSRAAALVVPLALPWMLAGPALAQGSAALALAPPPAAANPGAAATNIRMVVVHWKIKQGREAEFLDYWGQRSVVADRSGLVGEFLSSVEDRGRFPWINMQTVSNSYTSFFNIGIWRDAAAFDDQIGKYIDNARPPLPFEAERRERVLLQPERWRIGRTALSLADQPNVK